MHNRELIDGTRRLIATHCRDLEEGDIPPGWGVMSVRRAERFCDALEESEKEREKLERENERLKDNHNWVAERITRGEKELRGVARLLNDLKHPAAFREKAE